MGKPKVSIAIVSYNTASLLQECLNAVVEQSEWIKEIIVVDNNSGDGTQQLVRDKFPEVQLIGNKTNRGFAAANNQALPFCSGKYIFFLNPDTQLTPLAIETSINYMENNLYVGIAGTKLIHPDGAPQLSVSYSYPNQNRTRNFSANFSGKIATVMRQA